MNPTSNTSKNCPVVRRPGYQLCAGLCSGFLVVLFVAFNLFSTPALASETERDLFRQAWKAAQRGDHERFRQLKSQLNGYQLYPYLQYEDYRNRRAAIATDEMSAFLESHKAWAFSPALKKAWLRSLANKKRWADLVKHSAGVKDTRLRCQRARGLIITGQARGVLQEAQDLWVAGKSQPDECDPLFAWLVKQGGVTPSLAWQRIRLTMMANNRSLSSYLSRYVPRSERGWVDEWLRHSRTGFSRLEQIRKWPDNEITRSIAEVSIKRLARIDARQAARKFARLDSHFDWTVERRAGLLRDIALYSAVELNDDTVEQMKKVPPVFRDSQMLEWWGRFLLSRQDWSGLVEVIAQLPEEIKNDDRWRYWKVQAEIRTGQTAAAHPQLASLADKANYYGFLAADELGLDYSICPQPADVEQAAIDKLAARADIQRALELRYVELDNWATMEWSLATSRLPAGELKAAAALAHREGWADRVIFALGNSGDLQLYEWRFPLNWQTEILTEAAKYQLGPEWIYGIARSESAMQETARSSANAIGLMQITPATAKRVAKRHKMPWKGISNLKVASGNIPIGSAYLRDLLDDFDQNPVVVSAAYNAGPNAASRWLKSRPLNEAAIWIETLPYFETRDYIPRVLAFTTIYDWRMGGPVKRISVRMPHIESGKIRASGSTEVVCRESL